MTKPGQPSEWPAEPGRRTYPLRPSLAFPRRGIILPHNAHLRQTRRERWCFPMDLCTPYSFLVQDRPLHLSLFEASSLPSVYVEPVERGRPTDPIRLVISASTLEIALENSWPLSPATGLRHATRARGQILRGRSIGVGYVAVVSNYRRFRWIIRAWRRVEEGKYSREVFEGMLDD